MQHLLIRVSCLGVIAAAVTLSLPACGTGADDKAKNVSVAEVRADELDKAVADAKGKVVVVDFWATWCAPCVKKFPHLVEMHKKYADKGLVCISVSMDKLGPADEYKREKVLDFLKEKGATFPNYIVANPEADEKKLAARFGEFAGIPYMAVFDKTGRRVWDSDSTPFPAKEHAEKLEKLIQDQLAK